MLIRYSERETWPKLVSRIHFTNKAMIFAECGAGEAPVFFHYTEDGRDLAVLAGKTGNEKFSGWLHVFAPFSWAALRRELRAQSIREALLHSYQPIAAPSADYECIVDFRAFSSFEEFIRNLPRLGVRKYKKSRRMAVEKRLGTLEEFMVCLEDMCRRNRSAYHANTDALKSALRRDGEAALYSFLLDGVFGGANFVMLAMQEAYLFFPLVLEKFLPLDLGSYIFFDSLHEAFQGGCGLVNYGPASPWDGGYFYKHSMGAAPVPVYTRLLGASFWKWAFFAGKKTAKRLYGWHALRRVNTRKGG